MNTDRVHPESFHPWKHILINREVTFKSELEAWSLFYCHDIITQSLIAFQRVRIMMTAESVRRGLTSSGGLTSHAGGRELTWNSMVF